MKIYTLIESEDSFAEPYSLKALKSFKFLPNARYALANAILTRSQKDCLFARSLWRDENHGEEFRRFVSDKTGIEDVDSYFYRYNENSEFPDDLKRAVLSFVLENAEGDEAYHIFDSMLSDQTYHFNILENDLGGGEADEV